MSEGISATTASASPAASSTSTSTSSTPSSSQSSTTQSTSNQSSSPSSQGSTPPPQQNPTTSQQGSSESEYEEIALGSTKGKVPKDIAKAIKEYERGIQAKFRQNAETQKMLDLFDKDPEKFFQAKGKNFDEMAEERLARKYEIMQMSPEAREAMQLKQQIQEMKQAELASKSEVISEIKELLGKDAPTDLENAPKEHLQAYLQHQKQLMNTAQKEIEAEFVSAWQETGLPKDPFFGAQMAFRMMRNKNSNGTPLTAKEAANKIRSEWFSSVDKAFTNDLTGIMGALSTESKNAIRQYFLSQVNGIEAQNKGPAQQPQAASNQPKKQLNEIEWRKHMGLA